MNVILKGDKVLKRTAQILLLCSIFTLLIGCALNLASRNQATYHFQMGLSFLGEGNITGALVEFTAAEKIDPDNPDLQNNLGQVYYRKNKLDISEKKYLRAIALKPGYSDARNNLAVTYLEMKKWDEAIYQLKLVTEDIFYQNQSAAGINMALALYGKGDFNSSLATLRPMVMHYPADPRIRYNLGKIYYAMDKMNLAVAEYKRAIDIYADYAQAHYSLALAHMKQGEKRAASKSFQEVIRIAPDSEIGQLSREYLNLLK